MRKIKTKHALGRRGFFFVLEGGDGAGKSTLLARIEAFLQERGVRTLRTREPGGTPLAEAVRELVLSHGATGPGIDPRTELLLYEAARSHHVAHVIEPALRRGEIVLCDRFTFSSLAYQGGGRRLGFALVGKLNKIATGGLEPDLVVFLDIPPEKALGRVRRRGGRDRIDAESLAFHQRVRRAFLEIAEKEKSRCIALDATMAPEEIFDELIQHKLWKKIARTP